MPGALWNIIKHNPYSTIFKILQITLTKSKWTLCRLFSYPILHIENAATLDFSQFVYIIKLNQKYSKHFYIYIRATESYINKETISLIPGIIA